MSDQSPNNKSNVISIRSRKPFNPLNDSMLIDAGDHAPVIDPVSIDYLEKALNAAKNGRLASVTVVGIDPTHMMHIRYMADFDHSYPAYAYAGHMKAIATHFADLSLDLEENEYQKSSHDAKIEEDE